MEIFWLALNIVFAWLGWKWAGDEFQAGRNLMGWVYIFISAWNAAAALNVVT